MSNDKQDCIKVTLYLAEKAGRAVYRETFFSLSRAQDAIEARRAQNPDSPMRVEMVFPTVESLATNVE